MATKRADANELRTKALDVAVGQLEKQFGRGTLVRLGDDSFMNLIPAISTGSLSLDIALGVGGLPRGRVVEIFGPEASGKTTIALHTVAQAQTILRLNLPFIFPLLKKKETIEVSF